MHVERASISDAKMKEEVPVSVCLRAACERSFEGEGWHAACAHRLERTLRCGSSLRHARGVSRARDGMLLAHTSD